MDNFDDDFLEPLTLHYNQSDDNSPTPVLAFLFIIISIIVSCNFSISGAIGSYMETGEIVFPIANTIPEGGKRGFTQAEQSLMDMSASLLLVGLVIFFGKEDDTSLDGYKKHLFLCIILYLTMGSVDERIIFQSDTGFLWYKTIYQAIKYGYFVLCSGIYYYYCYSGKSLIRLEGSQIHFALLVLVPTMIGKWLMVSVLPSI